MVAETKADARRPRRPAPRHPPPHAGGVRPAAARRDARPAVDAAEDVVGQAAAGEVPRAVPRGAARARLTRMPMSTVAVFASDRQRLHDPEHEIESSALQAPFEHPGRAEAIRAALAADELLRDHRAAADGHGGDRGRPRSRPRALPRRSAWEEYQREIGPTHDVVPDVFAMPGLRAGMGPAVEPSPVGARLGWWCFETTTPLTAGTYEAARSAVDCALAATDAVLAGAPLAYGLCRPPGHHATTSLYGGYCFFNNAAIAAVHAGTVVARARRRARRRLPPRQRHPADLLRPRRRRVRVAARRPRAGLPVPHRTRRRDGRRAGERVDDEHPAARRHRRRRLPRRARPGARRARRVRPRARRRLARCRHVRRRPDVRPRPDDAPGSGGWARRSPASAVRSSSSRRAATPTMRSAPTSACAAVAFAVGASRPRTVTRP